MDSSNAVPLPESAPVDFLDSIASRWPPKSPHEALLSSPSGRDRVRRAYDRTSPSPSPYKGQSSLRRAQIRQRNSVGVKLDREDDDDEEEDEETLQLKLQAIEAKLKLKRLQQQRPAKGDSAPSPSDQRRGEHREIKENIPPAVKRNVERDRGPDVQVAGSPHKPAIQVPEQKSPGRVLLGIDKGLKGRNVSLRRPRREPDQPQEDFWRGSGEPKRHKGSSGQDAHGRNHVLAGKSFSERIAESRKSDELRIEREVSRHTQRSKGFAVGREEIDASKQSLARAAEVQESRKAQSEIVNRDGFSREQILKALNKEDSGIVKRGRSKKPGFDSKTDSTSKVWMNPNAEPDFTRPTQTDTGKAKPQYRQSSPEKQLDRGPADDRNDTSESADQLFEPFSTIHLSKRFLTKDLLTRTFTGKSILRVMDLLANVKAPDYLLPESMEADYVVTGIIATKSAPIAHKETIKSTSTAQTTSYDEATSTSQNTKGKFMVLQLTDLKWSVDLYLFTTAYTRFYKLTPGTVVAVLNPGIMPPPPGKTDTGRFSLTLNSSDDTVLEIGTARDLAWCKATRKDGKPCTDWVDKRHTEYCEFHVDRVIQQVRRGRMEVNGMSAPFAPGGEKGSRTGFFGKNGNTLARSRWGQAGSNDSNNTNNGDRGLTSEGRRYDRTTSSSFFVAPAIPGRSAAALLDREDILLNRGGSKEERARKRLAERERENEIARQLGDKGNGAGANYLRASHTAGEPRAGAGDAADTSCRAAGDMPPSQDSEVKVDARSLGLLGHKAVDVHISPIKKAKPGLKRKEGQAALSPRKKTRFVLDKGIREAGRESLPMMEHGSGNDCNDDDDDDDLEIG